MIPLGAGRREGPPRKKHVINEQWQEGGFHAERFIRCRCGQKFKHYNAGYLRELFRDHQTEMRNRGEE